MNTVGVSLFPYCMPSISCLPPAPESPVDGSNTPMRTTLSPEEEPESAGAWLESPEPLPESAGAWLESPEPLPESPEPPDPPVQLVRPVQPVRPAPMAQPV